jgi:rod shape determining protein RodA
MFRTYLNTIDPLLLGSALLLTVAGAVTMNSFSGDNIFFTHQIWWLCGSLVVFILTSMLDARVFRQTSVVMTLYFLITFMFVLLLVVGTVILGAKNRFDLGFFSLQPADPAQIVLVLILAKYFSRRHVEIAHLRHIIVSGAYAFIFFALLFFQPDFGSAMIVFSIWLGMVLIAGISKKHLLTVVLLGAVTFGGLWLFAFQDYQKARIMTFLNPLTDIHGAGYNAYQSTIAVGSGQLFGKGVGYGTQSKLAFLPEYETDFIFAAFAEEWGFVGVCVLFVLFGILIWRVLAISRYGAGNFEMLYGVGVVIVFMSHIIIHVGMNIGLMPVTGITIPFLSYGGSHLITEFAALGILTSMRRYSRAVPREEADNEFLGV